MVTDTSFDGYVRIQTFQKNSLGPSMLYEENDENIVPISNMDNIISKFLNGSNKPVKDVKEKPVKEKIVKEPKKVEDPEITAPAIETSIPQQSNLHGLRILPTGLFNHFSRETFRISIEQNGGIYGSGGVNKKLDILIVGKNAGPAKIERAEELGIKIIDEAEYLKMIY